MKKFIENLGDRWTRPARVPLRTFKEMAEEFGVPPAILQRALCEDCAPKPVMQNSSFTKGLVSWYNPTEMRKWWKSRGEK